MRAARAALRYAMIDQPAESFLGPVSPPRPVRLPALGRSMLVALILIPGALGGLGLETQSQEGPTLGVEAVIGLGWLQGAWLNPAGTLLATCSDADIHLWRPDGSLASTLHAPEAVSFAAPFSRGATRGADPREHCPKAEQASDAGQ